MCWFPEKVKRNKISFFTNILKKSGMKFKTCFKLEIKFSVHKLKVNEDPLSNFSIFFSVQKGICFKLVTPLKIEKQMHGQVIKEM